MMRQLKEKTLKLVTRENFFTRVTAKPWDRQPKEIAHPPLWAFSAKLGKALSKLIRSQH